MSVELKTDGGHVLRCWTSADASDLLAAMQGPEMQSQVVEPLVTVADAEQWIADHVASWEAGTGFSWAITNDDALLGSVTLGSVNRRHGLGWMSYWTCAHARGAGVASSALRRLSLWAFEELDLYRLELGHRVNNPASCRVATAAGFVAEGIEREKLRYGNDRFDVELHARLATDPAP